jgi:hypothetical protein
MAERFHESGKRMAILIVGIYDPEGIALAKTQSVRCETCETPVDIIE